jgi:hypothetical protein
LPSFSGATFACGVGQYTTGSYQRYRVVLHWLGTQGPNSPNQEIP